MDILSYLTEIIKTRKEVGIPGLGTFYKRKSPGRYNSDTHSFIAPSYLVDFTEELREQVVLKDFISKKENIASDNAIFYIDQFAAEIKEQLKRDEKVQLGTLGILQTDLNGVIFIPEHESNVGFDFYGMPDIKEEPLPAKDQTLPDEVAVVEKEDKTTDRDDQQVYEEISEVRVAEKVKPAIIIETPEGLEEESAELPESNEVDNIWKFEEAIAPEPQYEPASTDNEQTSGMPAYLKFILVISVVVIAAIVVYMLKPELFKKSTSHNTAVNHTDSLVVPDKKADTAAYTDSLALTPAPTPDSLKDALSKQHPDTVISYEIIAASLLNKKEADNFLKEMEKRGIPAKIANMPGKRIKVSIGTFTDEETANTQLKLLKNTTRIPGIYIYTNRHTNNIK